MCPRRPVFRIVRPFAVPEVPKSQEDIFAYIQWLEGFSFLVQQKKGVTEKLRSVMSNTPDLMYCEVLSIHLSFFNNS